MTTDTLPDTTLILRTETSRTDNVPLSASYDIKHDYLLVERQGKSYVIHGDDALRLYHFLGDMLLLSGMREQPLPLRPSRYEGAK